MNLWTRIRWVFDSRSPAYIRESGGKFYADVYWDGKYGLSETIVVPYATLDSAVTYLESQGYKVALWKPIIRKVTGLYK